ncbi:MAG: DNA adenine methylase [Candidatus Omnitrophica bacterium]|nr:DNA adenine methylase [Candidatus Omnitrophota bacterium]
MVLHPTINLTAKLSEISENHEENRNNLRKIVIDTFIRESAGRGKGEETSKYKYIVETLSSGEKVYLTRPVPLNKGFDFIVHVENYIFMNGKDNPKHDDIKQDLQNKKQLNAQAYNKLVEALEEVFYCNDPDDIYSRYIQHLVSLNQGLSNELILKIVKWFFIEQDIRYWNWSGRNMFMEGIRNI